MNIYRIVVRCRVCGFSERVATDAENRWYETHHCDNMALRDTPGYQESEER